MKPERRLRILHLPVDLGGHPSALAKAQRALGHEAVSANLAWSDFGFNGDLNFGRPMGDRLRLPVREAGRMRLMLRSILWADVIHGHFGQVLTSLRAYPPTMREHETLRERTAGALMRWLWLKDVSLWRRLGKTVAMTFYGDDLRLVSGATDRNAWSHLGLTEISGPLADRDPLKKRLVSSLDASGVTMFATNPDLMPQLPAERNRAQFLPYGHVDIAAIKTTPPGDGPIRFLHLPTNRAVKGTEHVIDAIGKLKRAGKPCELTIAEGVSNSTAIELMGTHDVLLDQLRAGWYGGVAVEAMAAGKPVVAHILEQDLAHIPAEMARDLPIINANPDTVFAVLRDLVAEPRDSLADRARASRAYVERWHAPGRVAAQVMEAYRGAGA